MSIALEMSVSSEKVEVLKRELTKGSPFQQTLTWFNGASFEYAGTQYYLFGKTETDKTMKDNGLYASSVQFKLCTDTQVTLGETEPIYEWHDTFDLRFDVIPETIELTFSDNRSHLERLLDEKRLFFKVQMSSHHDAIVTKSFDGSYLTDYGEVDLEMEQVQQIIMGYQNGNYRWTFKVTHDESNVFFAALERELEVLDTLDDDQEIVTILKESMTKLAKPNLILNVEGGVVHDALSSLPVNLVVLDGDTEGFETDEIKTIEGDKYFVNPVEVRDDVEGVMNLVNLIHEAQTKSEM